MTGPRRLGPILEVVLGLAPVTLVLPFLFIGGLGTALAVIRGGAVDWATIVLVGWVIAGMLGIATLWVVVLTEATATSGRNRRLLLSLGLLLGMAAALRWLWVMGTGRHRYGAGTWAVWLLLLGGPLVVAGARLARLWSSSQSGLGRARSQGISS